MGNSRSATGFEAFRWTLESGMVGLGDLPGGAFSSNALGVSADGSAVVGRGRIAQTPAGTLTDSEGFRWTEAEGMQPLGNLPGGLGSQANAISDDGNLVVGIANAINDHDGEAFRWTATEGIVGLGDLRPTGTTVSSAWGISGDGQVIVGETGTQVGRQGFWLTDATGMVALDHFPGEGTWDRATAVSADGSVIVGVGNSASGVNNTEAYRWTAAGGYIGLGDLPGGIFNSRATDVSGDGSIVVGASFTDTTGLFGTEAFIWTNGDGMRDLRLVLQKDYGLDLSGWILTEATGISADGRTIVGFGQNPAGDQEAWLVSLEVPEPNTALLFLSACVGWLGFTRGKN